MLRDRWIDLQRIIRGLLREPGFTTAAVVILGLGIGLNVLTFGVVRTLLEQPVPYEQTDDMVRLYVTNAEGVPFGVSYPEFVDLAGRTDLFTEAAFNSDIGIFNLVSREGAETILGEMLSPNFFSFVRLPPFLGRDFTAEEGLEGSTPVVMLSYSAWQQRYGGDPAILGERIRINGEPLTVIGVGPRDFSGTMTGLDSEIFLPWGTGLQIAQSARDSRDQRNSREIFMMARLRPGLDIEGLRPALAVQAKSFAADHAEFEETGGIGVWLASEVRMHPIIDKASAPASAFLMAVVVLVLLVAASNLFGLMLVRAWARRREVGIRLAMGSSRTAIVRRMVAEAVVIALAGGAFGLMLAAALGRFAGLVAPPLPVPFDLGVALGPGDLAFAFGLAVFTGVILGFVPAMQATGGSPIHSLKSAGNAGEAPRGSWMRRVLVIAQVAGSCLLLVVAGFFLESLAASQSQSLGFETESTALAFVDQGIAGVDTATAHRQYQELLRQASLEPGFRSAALMSRVPLSMFGGSSVQVEPLGGQDRERGILALDTAVSPELFSTLGIPVRAGRAFTAADNASAPPVAVLGEGLARALYGEESPIGGRLRMGEDGAAGEVEIVGVVGGTRASWGTAAADSLQIYFPLDQSPRSGVALVVNGRSQSGNLPEQLRQMIRAMDADAPVLQASTLDQSLSLILYPARFAAILLTAVGVLALVLASLGLYGVVAYAVSRRSRELGIRAALGAGRRRLVVLVLREGVVLSSIGVVIGLAGSLAITRILRSRLFDVQSVLSPWILAMIALLLAVTLLACWIPGRRAADVDPATALRAE